MNIFQHFKQMTEISTALYCFSNKKIPLHIDNPQSTTCDKKRCVTNCALYYISCAHYLLRTLKKKQKEDKKILFQ